MKFIQHAAHPAVISLLIIAFTWLLFFSPLGQGIEKAMENEREREYEAGRNIVPAPDPNLQVIAGQQGLQSPEEIPFDPRIPQNDPARWNNPDGNVFDPGANKQASLDLQWNAGPDSPFYPGNQQKQLRQFGADVAYAPSAQYADPYIIRPVQGNVAPSAPRAQQPAGLDKVLQEAHWIGLEAITLTPALARANDIPPDVTGVLIDEVTMLSAVSGLLAGDVITAVNGRPVADLRSFKDSTKPVALFTAATVTVFRGGRQKEIEVEGPEELGIAQVESAPTILSGARSPHGYYGPCDRCHHVTRSAENPHNLKFDAGDNLTKIAPAIQRGVPPPHRDRGECITCHTIL